MSQRVLSGGSESKFCRLTFRNVCLALRLHLTLSPLSQGGSGLAIFPLLLIPTALLSKTAPQRLDNPLPAADGRNRTS